MDDLHYQFTPINSGQIRILDLKPGKKDDPLIGELKAVDVEDDDLRYDTLSYLWGDPAPVETIQLSGSILPIARNLSIALQNLRYTEKSLIIWVDAICINQKDLSERSEQVQGMRRLYGHAEMVRVWIQAPSVNVSCDAFKELQTFHKTEDPMQNYGLGTNPQFWLEIQPIFKNPYWSRVWIQQEIASARDMTIHVKNSQIRAEAFKQLQHALYSIFTVPNPTQEFGEWYWSFSAFLANIPILRNYFRWSIMSAPLSSVLLSSTSLVTTEPQDRVYALMHIASNFEDNDILVDYRKSEVDVLLDVAQHHLKKQRDLDFLKECICVTEAYSGIPLPTLSWIPQCWFGRNVSARSLPDRFDSICPWGFEAAPDAVLRAERQLRVRAIRVDHVASVLYKDSGELGNAAKWDFFQYTALATLIRSQAGISIQNRNDELFRILMDAEETEVTCEEISDALSYVLRLPSATHNGGMRPLNTNQCEPPVNPVLKNTMSLLDNHLWKRCVITTATEKLGLMADCGFKLRDEIWVVLGCSYPIVLRPQEDGTYRVMATVFIPKLEELDELREFSVIKKPGDRIGDWTVEDIILS